jgi:hypothetical protein
MVRKMGEVGAYIQIAFEALLGIVAFLVSMQISDIKTSITQVKQDTKDALEQLNHETREFPKIYLAKDDYRTDIAEIKSLLRQLFEELKSKADK